LSASSKLGIPDSQRKRVWLSDIRHRPRLMVDTRARALPNANLFEMKDRILDEDMDSKELQINSFLDNQGLFRVDLEDFISSHSKFSQ